MITQEQLKNMEQRIEKLHKYLNIDKKQIEISNEEEKTVAPGFWDKPKEAELLLKNL